MSDPTTSHTEPSRPAYYLTADDALAFARYHHVPGARGWSQALMDENLPGWNLNEVMHLLHQVARETYHASPVRPSLVLNVSGALIDPFDPPTDEHSREFADHYQADVCSLLRRVRESKSKVVLATLVVHDDGEPVEVRRTGPAHLPPKLRTDRTGIRSVVVGVRADALRDELRAEVVERLVRLVGRGELAMR